MSYDPDEEETERRWVDRVRRLTAAIRQGAGDADGLITSPPTKKPTSVTGGTTVKTKNDPTTVRIFCADCGREWDRCPIDRTADSVAEAVGYGWVCQGTGHRCPECVAERQGGSE